MQEEGDITDLELDTLVATAAVSPTSTNNNNASSSKGGNNGNSSPTKEEGSQSSSSNGTGCGNVTATITGNGKARATSPTGESDDSNAPRGLQELDLRQLDGVVYEKGGGKSKVGGGGLLGGMLAELDTMKLGQRVKKVKGWLGAMGRWRLGYANIPNICFATIAWLDSCLRVHPGAVEGRWVEYLEMLHCQENQRNNCC